MSAPGGAPAASLVPAEGAAVGGGAIAGANVGFAPNEFPAVPLWAYGTPGGAPGGAPAPPPSAQQMEQQQPGAQWGQEGRPSPMQQQQQYAQYVQPPPAAQAMPYGASNPQLYPPQQPQGYFPPQYRPQQQPQYQPLGQQQPYLPPQQQQSPFVAAPNLQPTPLMRMAVRDRADLLYANAEGKLVVNNRPGCMMTCFMLPFPFFCMGCCLSESNDLVFDDRAQRITIQTWPGYCLPCKSPERVIPYSEVANFVFTPSSMLINKQRAYNIALLTKAGERIKLSDPDLIRNNASRLLGYHQFLFGRAHPEQYQQPSTLSLIEFGGF